MGLREQGRGREGGGAREGSGDDGGSEEGGGGAAEEGVSSSGLCESFELFLVFFVIVSFVRERRRPWFVSEQVCSSNREKEKKEKKKEVEEKRWRWKRGANDQGGAGRGEGERRRGIPWPRTAAAATEKRRSPLVAFSIHPPQRLSPLFSKSSIFSFLSSKRSQLRRTCASAAVLLLGKAAAAVFTNARGVEAAVLLPAPPRAEEDAAVFDEACIASIAGKRGFREKAGASL